MNEKITTNVSAELAIERSIMWTLWNSDGDGLLKGLAILAEQCQPPLNTWIQGRNGKILSLAWDQILIGKIEPTQVAIYEYLDAYRFADALDAISGRNPRKWTPCTHEDGSMSGIGGFQGIIDMTDGALSARACLRDYAIQLRNIRHRSVTIETLREIAKRVASSPLSTGPSAAMLDGIERLSGIATSTKEQTIGDGLHRAQDRAEKFAANLASGNVRTASWGLPSLNAACKISNGGLYVLAARPGVGKTSLALQAAVETAGNGCRVGIVSMEMGADQLATIVASRVFGISRAAIEERDPRISDETWQKMRALADKWKQERRIIIMDGANTGQRMTIETIAAWARINVKIGGLNFLIIDHCQLISSNDPRAREYDVISNATRTLKTLAQALQIPILLLSQMSRDQDKVGQGRNGVAPTARAPRLSDLRGSGSLEQDSDAVMFLHNESESKENPRVISCTIPKNRAGPPAELNIIFDGRWQSFSEASKTECQDHVDMIKDRAARNESKPNESENLFI